jgi:glycosyltransferase involved in cell wall biosynthesis
MRVLIAHNYYQQPGGEDNVYAAEAALLEQRGHTVIRYSTHNDRVSGMSQSQLAMKTIWNRESYSEFRDIIRRESPDVCHFHNWFPLISPAAFHAAKAEGKPVVMTLHNFRLLCPGFTLLRENQICEDCVSKRLKWPAIVHKCYRQNRGASAVTALSLFSHSLLGTWHRTVDRYIALTEAGRRKFLEGGLPAAKVAVKANFLMTDPGYSEKRGDHVLFAGRLSEEKGIRTLLDAWRLLQAPIRLRIAGDGPMADVVRQAAEADSRIEWLGRLTAQQVSEEMRRAHVLVMPSVWYEGLPLTLIEAFATGLPVLASKLGSLAELVHHGETGYHFAPGDPTDLANSLLRCQNDSERLREMGRNARRVFEERYTAESNYQQLMKIYEGVGVKAEALAA